MATAVKTCRVCGKQYEACRTMMNRAAGVFRWQEVACSPECGAEYLRRVTEARNPAPPAPKRGQRRKAVIEPPVVQEVPAEQSAQADESVEAPVEEK